LLLVSYASSDRWRTDTLKLKTPTVSTIEATRSRLYVLPGEVVRVSVEGKVGRYPGDKPADFRGQPLYCGTVRHHPTLCNLTLFCFVAGRSSGPKEEVVEREGRYMNFHHPSVRQERKGFAWTAQDAGFVHCGINAHHVASHSQGGFTVTLSLAEGAEGTYGP
jgi:hypothetical protein